MATLLLATKLFIPTAKSGLVERPRLVERLNTALSYGLVVVSAPAGFGQCSSTITNTRLVPSQSAWNMASLCRIRTANPADS